MRQVFTSVRLENVEAVERLLNEAGIQTKLSQGRSWKGNSRREFSYSNKNHDPSHYSCDLYERTRIVEILLIGKNGT